MQFWNFTMRERPRPVRFKALFVLVALLGATAPFAASAQTREEAALAVRIQQLEEQLRVMTGQVEGLQFQLTQLQTLIERMNEDIDFRFQALEGGEPGKTEAVTQPGGATPVGELPQTQAVPPATPAVPAPAETAPTQTAAAQPFEIPANDTPLHTPADLAQGQTLPGGNPLPPLDVDESLDPMLNGGAERPLGTLSEQDLAALSTNQPLSLDYDPGNVVSDRDAEAQYRAGYDAVARGDYAFAEDQFEQFIALYPEHPRAPDATNWLGEARLQRGEYDAAADILLTGFQNYPEAAAAPDLLTKLGIALAGAGEQETACRTFGEVERRYPAITPDLRQRLSDERAKAAC